MIQNTKKISESKQDLMNNSALNCNKETINSSQQIKSKSDKQAFEDVFSTNKNDITKNLNFINSENDYCENTKKQNMFMEIKDNNINKLERCFTDKIKKLENSLPDFNDTDESNEYYNNQKNLIPKKFVHSKRLSVGIDKGKRKRFSVLQPPKPEPKKNENAVFNLELTNEEYIKLYNNHNKNSPIYILYNRKKLIDITLAIFTILNIIFGLLENELFYLKTNDYLKEYFSDKIDKEITVEVYNNCKNRKISTHENTFRIINLIIVINMVFINIWHYSLKIEILKEKNILTDKDGFCSSGNFKFLFIETILLLIVDPPTINEFYVLKEQGYIFAFSLGGVINIITFIKSYTILRLYAHFSSWINFKKNSIMVKKNNQNFDGNMNFLFKSELKNRPFIMLIFMFIISILVFGYFLRSFEYFSVKIGFKYGIYIGNGNDQDYLKDLLNSIWLTILTMTTVGYGDFYPSEICGQIIMLFAYIIGTFCVSMSVVALAMTTEFSNNERRAYSTIKKINMDSNISMKAGDVIGTLLDLRYYIKGKKCKLSERFIYIVKLKKNVLIFKDDYKLASSMPLPFDQTLLNISNKIDDYYVRINTTVKSLRHVNYMINGIYKNQKDSVDKLEQIKVFKNNICKYLININNINYKQKLCQFKIYEIMNSQKSFVEK